MSKSYNSTPPAEVVALTRQIEIGWEHTIDDDKIVLTLDEAGQPIPRSYTIPTQVTVDQTRIAAQRTRTELKDGEVLPGLDFFFIAVDAITGGLVEKVSQDLTVSHEQLVKLVFDLADEYGVQLLFGQLGIFGMDGQGNGSAPDGSTSPQPSGAATATSSTKGSSTPTSAASTALDGRSS